MPSKIDAVRFLWVSRTLAVLGAVAVLVLGSIIGVSLLAPGSLRADVELDVVGRILVTVIDAEGNPVEGAELHVRGLRTRKNPSTGHGPGKIKSVTTNEAGEAEIAYPRYVYEEMETGQIILEITHPKFIKLQEEYSVDAEIVGRLKSGRRIEFTAVDGATGLEISEGLFVLTPGQVEGEKWTKTAEGTLITNTFDPNLATMLLVHVRDDEPVLFSDLIDLRSCPAGDCQMGRIELSPGTRCAGWLSDVPRPVKNGHVGLIVAMTMNDSSTYNDHILWRDFTDVDEEGAFEFPSVPRDAAIQLLADCSGWVSSSESPEEMLRQMPNVTTLEHAQSLHDLMVVAQEFAVDDSDPFEVRMEPTSTCNFKVTDDKGAPLANATVYAFPNAYFFPGASTLVATHVKSSEILRLSVEGLWTSDFGGPDRRRIGRKYIAVTDENGLATIDNLPAKTGIDVSIEHEEYQLPPGENPYHRNVNLGLGLELIRPTDVTFQLEPKGRNILGR